MEQHVFWQKVVERLQKTGEHERYGQAAFNLLAIERPDLSEAVRASNIDPFYLTRAEGPRWDGFVTFLNENW